MGWGHGNERYVVGTRKSTNAMRALALTHILSHELGHTHASLLSSLDLIEGDLGGSVVVARK